MPAHTAASSIILCLHQESPGFSQATGFPSQLQDLPITLQPCGHLLSLQGAWSTVCRNSLPSRESLVFGKSSFRDPEARGVSQPMETHGANKETQDPQRAPRTPGVRSQALHLCANGAGLGIIRAPNYVQLSGLFVQRDQGDFWLPSHLSSTELSEAEGKRVSHCLLGEHWGRAGERQGFNR